MPDLKQLKTYPFTGHSVLMGKRDRVFQDADYILRFFGKTRGKARRGYQSFVSKGLAHGRRPELTGGGLVRSFGGWSAIKELRFHDKRVKGDERLLGSSEFVDQVLKQANEQFEEKARLRARGIDLETLAENVAARHKVDPDDLKSSTKKPAAVEARAVFCYLSARKLGESAAAIARVLHVTPSAASKLAARGKTILQEQGGNSFLEEFHNFTDVP